MFYRTEVLTVTVSVQSVGNNAPVFESQNYIREVSESSFGQTVILRVKVSHKLVLGSISDIRNLNIQLLGPEI